MSVDHSKLFRDEAEELLSDLEQMLLELESDPTDTGCVDKLFRAVHTIKGSGAMFGFDELARFTHDVETVFDKVRSGELALDRPLLTLSLAAKDHIHALLESLYPPEELSSRSDELIAQFRAYLGESPQPQSHSPEGTAGQTQAAPSGYDPSQARTWLIRFRPAPGTFLSGTDPLGLISELEELGKLWGVFRAGDIPSLADIAPQTAYGWWDILLITDRGLDAIKDVFIFVEDESGLEYGEIHSEPIRESDAPALTEKIAAMETEGFRELRDELAAMIADRVSRRAAPGARPAVQAAEAQAATSIRVDSDRLDKLVNLVGELVIVQSRLTQAVAGTRENSLRSIAEDLQRLSAEMRDQALGIRMVPIGSIYGTMRRLVRDLCESTGKQAEFVGLGAQTELDKNVIDQIKDPLVHILRNSVDHGLEPPEERAAAGKPEKGRVTLDAVHTGGSILITISDDGAGIDTARIRAKAVERGLLAPGDEPGERELMKLIFAPGFSTARKVTNVSGRGVGMDVVKKNIEKLRGTVEIDSTLGQGTVISIRLPLTLAIIDGLQVQVGPELYVLPLTATEACQERFLESAPSVVGSIEHRGALIPCLSLRRLLDVPGDQPRYERVIVARVDGNLMGLAVDAVIGQQQAVIKPLAEVLGGVHFIAGTTVTGDGGISVILDVPNLVEFALEVEKRELSA